MVQKSKLWHRRALIPLLSPAQPRLTEFPVLAEAGGGAGSAGANSCGCPGVSSGLSCAAETPQFPSERISAPPVPVGPSSAFSFPSPGGGRVADVTLPAGSVLELVRLLTPFLVPRMRTGC